MTSHFSVSSPSSGIIRFSNDDTLLSTVKNVSKIAVNLNFLTSDVLSWARQNRMTLNATKTKCMLVTSQQTQRRLLSSKSLYVSINHSPIQQLCCAKVLGVTFDKSASWEPCVKCLESNFRVASPYSEESALI